MDFDELEEEIPYLESPEKRLWGAVLMQAVKEIEDGDLKGEVMAWIENNGFEIGSFPWVCAVLGLDPGWIREGLAKRDA